MVEFDVVEVAEQESRPPVELELAEASLREALTLDPKLHSAYVDAEMVARFKRELKLKETMTMADAVGEACSALGVKREGSLIEQAQKCWAVLCG